MKMNPRLEELLQRMVAGKFPNMTCSEGHELVNLVYGMAETQADLIPRPESLLCPTCEKPLSRMHNKKIDGTVFYCEYCRETRQSIK